MTTIATKEAKRAYDIARRPEYATRKAALRQTRWHLIVFHCDGMERRIGLPFHADGSGADYALGAMQMGAGAERVVRVAAMWDGKTGGEITVLRR